MRIKLFVAALCCIFSLPFTVSKTTPPGLRPVAVAGHTHAGQWCATPCCYGCIPDEGEQCVLCTQSSVNIRPSDAAGDASVTNTPEGFGFDPGPGLLFIALAFLAWSRFKGAV